MKITDIEVIYLRIPPVGTTCVWGEDCVIVKVHTDKGIVGVGESDSSPLVVKSVIETPNSNLACFGLKELLIGENPLEIERLYNKMYVHSNYLGRRGAGIHAISAIDIALWDIAGKYYNVPVHTLLGGKYRDKIQAYGTFIPADKPEDNKKLVRDILNEGFTSVKFGGGILGDCPQTDIEIIKAVREEAGEDVQIQIDLAGKWRTAGHTIDMSKKLEEFNLNWIEEPVISDNISSYKKIASTIIPKVAGGETLTTKYEFKEFLEKSDASIVQPDITRCGGITEMKKIYDLADIYGVQLVPHGFSTGILIAATVHFLAASEHGTLIEYSKSKSELFTKLVKNRLECVNGYVYVPEGPGLGIELDEEIIAKYRID